MDRKLKEKMPLRKKRRCKNQKPRSRRLKKSKRARKNQFKRMDTLRNRELD